MVRHTLAPENRETENKKQIVGGQTVDQALPFGSSELRSDVKDEMASLRPKKAAGQLPVSRSVWRGKESARCLGIGRERITDTQKRFPNFPFPGFRPSSAPWALLHRPPLSVCPPGATKSTDKLISASGIFGPSRLAAGMGSHRL